MHIRGFITSHFSKMASLECEFDELIVDFLKETRLKIQKFKAEQQMILKSFFSGRDVFAQLPTGYGKSLVFQAMPDLCVFFRHRGFQQFTETPVVIVACPLKSIISEQISLLTSIGITAANIGDPSYNEDLLAGNVRIIFGSPEALGSEATRKLLTTDFYQKNVVGLVCDEVHTVTQWGLAGKDAEPFRVWCSKIGELRSFLENVPLVALTASSKSVTRKKIIDVLSMHQCINIIANPDRRNIKLHVREIENDIHKHFSWLVRELKLKREQSERVIIYCKSIRQCTEFFTFFKSELGKSLYIANKPERAQYRLVAMYHSSTDEKIKNCVSQSLTEPDGCIRVVIATSALGMGIDIKGLHTVINYGPPNCIESYYQAFGRAGRDGEQSHAVLLYHGRQLRKCDAEMLTYLKHDGCRRELLLKFFDTSVNLEPVLPKHLCCDNCVPQCSCGDRKACNKFNSSVEEISEQSPLGNLLERSVTEEQRERLAAALIQKRGELLTKNQDVTFCSSLDLFKTFSLSLVNEVKSKCNCLFSVDDILNRTCVYSYEHAQIIFQCLAGVFTDMEDDNEFYDLEV